MATCRSCAHENEAGARYCSMCATPLTAAAAERHEERRVVTVLFADLVGFTARAETLDPEEVSAFLSPYFAHMRTELERFGGTVEKFIGDAVMALFGAPVAHEDDPERAVRAALAVRDWVVASGGGLQLRLGVNTGEALVALYPGSRHEGEGLATGDIVNTAARLQAAAPVNGILVGEATYRATSRSIEYRDAAPVTAKGKAQPVRVWEAIRPLPLPISGAGEPGRGALVGRDHELEVLTAALAKSVANRDAQLVTVVGAPGIGKTRLLAEFFQRVHRRTGEDPLWLRGRSLPYGAEVTLGALSEIVKAQAGILESDRPDVAEAKLASTVHGVVADQSDARWLIDHLRPLAGLDGQAEVGQADRDEMFTAWRHFFEALAQRQATVLVFEDLHWADDTLLDFVEHLVAGVSSSPLLLLCTARPELVEKHGGSWPRIGSAKTLSLSPLSEEDTSLLITDLLQDTEIAAETRDALLTRAGGNPLYAEHYVRMLRERAGDRDLPLPDTVQGIIAARLDGLPPDEKLVLQNAAVIGKVFWFGALATVGGMERDTALVALRSLDRKGFVRTARQSPVADEAEYTFLHILVRDVAYSQIPRARRATKHRRAAEWLDSLGRAEDHAEMLAHHYLSAIKFDRASGQEIRTEDLARAQRYLLLAAGRAERLYANDQAIAHLHSAMELDEVIGSSEERRQLVLRCARLEDRRGAFAEAVRLYDQALEESDDLVAALGRVGVLRKLGEYAQCLEAIQNIKAHHPGSTPEQAAAIALEEGLVLTHTGDLHGAVTALTAGHAAVAGRGLHLEGELLASLASREALVRRYEDARSHAEQARALFQEKDDLPGLARALRVLGAVVAEAPAATQPQPGSEPSVSRPEHWIRSREILEEALALARRVGDAEEEAASLTNLARTLWLLGRTEEALRCDRESLAAFERVGLRAGVAAALGNLTEHLGMLGRWDECKAASLQQLAVAREIGQKIWTMRALNGLAEATLALGELPEAAAAAEEAANLALTLDDEVAARGALEKAVEARRRLGDSERAGELTARIGDLRDKAES